MKKLPELLCPAGSPEALDAAIEGGADAVYFGGAQFNARMNAQNFGGDALRSAVLRAHSYGVKVYLTLNTLVGDRELPQFVAAAGEAAAAGVDALIIADMGGAAAVHRVYPELELHASTQMSGHNAEMGRVLQNYGYSRMVLARETSYQNLKEAVSSSPIETEIFIHGALCVSHSGQCLFSSLVGGRSGNRGECAQPCRLPFACAGCKKNEGYPLSLKDLTLASHVTEILELGVASLKIEGRMKSPEYVRDTARIWRRLLDERRNATPNELQILSNAFSRGGFTDGYFTEVIGSKMLGVRSEADKSISRAQEPFTGITRKLPLDLSVKFCKGLPITLSLSNGKDTVTVSGDIPMEAIRAPMDKDALCRSLSKFGGTPYEVRKFDATMDPGLMLPVSRLNDLRRRALSALLECSAPKQVHAVGEYKQISSKQHATAQKSARFYSAAQITPRARAYFDRIYLPFNKYTSASKADGVVLPPVIFDRDIFAVRSELQKAKAAGAAYALVGNLGHLSLAKKAGLIPVGDYRLNVTNSESLLRMEEMGFADEIILSPELTLPQLRDIKGNKSTIVYGRLPLMTLEKCVIRELADCKTCERGKATLCDRRGVVFPVLREWEHRNVICNSLPTNMSDRTDALQKNGLLSLHFLFTVESPAEVDGVIEAFLSKTALPGQCRRINQ